MRTMRDSTRKGAQWVTTALLDDGEWNDEGIGIGEADGEPSCNVQLRWLKTENEKEQGNGSNNGSKMGNRCVSGGCGWHDAPI